MLNATLGADLRRISLEPGTRKWRTVADGRNAGSFRYVAHRAMDEGDTRFSRPNDKKPLTRLISPIKS